MLPFTTILFSPAGNDPFAVLSNSVVDTMKRTHGGSSDGSQCSVPVGLPSLFNRLTPSIIITIFARLVMI